MKLSIILPIRNESENIVKTLNLLKENIENIDYELVIINDFSEDNSYETISNEKKNNNKIKLFNNDIKGLGGAITLGINKSEGDVICIIKILTHKTYPYMIEYLKDKKAKIPKLANNNNSANLNNNLEKGRCVM